MLDGVGILMRSGQAEINTVSMSLGDAVAGKVGDSNQVIESNAICVDMKSNYPESSNTSVIIKGGVFTKTTAGSEVPSVLVISDNETDKQKVQVIKGSFKPPIDEIYIAEGSSQTISSNGTGAVKPE